MVNKGKIAKDCTYAGRFYKSRECSFDAIHGQHDSSLASVSIKPDNKERLDHRYWQLYRNSIVLRIALPLLELHVARANMRVRSWPSTIIYGNYVSFDVFAVANESI